MGKLNVLKLSHLTGNDPVPLLKLEGKLLEPWVEELLGAWAAARAQSGGLRLDLSGVSFVDAAGVRVLRGLLDQGVTIVACSSFVAELLHLEAP
jgi:anti-anti-sigma regulatory factor